MSLNMLLINEFLLNVNAEYELIFDNKTPYRQLVTRNLAFVKDIDF